MGDNKNGKLPNAATRSQANAENKKVCCRFNLNCFSKLERINKTPIKIVINDAPTKL